MMMRCILYIFSNNRPFLLSFLNRLSNCLFPICVPIHVDPGNGGVRNQSQSWDGLDLYQCGLSLSMRGLFKSLSTVGDQCDGLFSLRDAPNLWVASAGSHTIGFQQGSYVSFVLFCKDINRKIGTQFFIDYCV